MVTRVLLLGEAPNAATVGRPDLWLRPDLSGIAHAANRLRDYAGWSTSEFLRVFAHRDNVAERPPARWDAAAVAAARARALRLVEEHYLASGGNLYVVCVGRRAADAVGMPPRCLPFVQHRVGQYLLGKFPPAAAYVPHPSGRNRWWNEPLNLERARMFLQVAARVAGVPIPVRPRVVSVRDHVEGRGLKSSGDVVE